MAAKAQVKDLSASESAVGESEPEEDKKAVQTAAEKYTKREQIANPTMTSADGSQPRSKTVIKTAKQKIGRNDPCPCGSGKKYKKCCGKDI